jgi:hypothetical protein
MSFLHHFGRMPVYWFAIIFSFVSCIVLDVGIITLRVAFFPKDSDVFAELEKDPLIKARFEEEAAAELQQGWNREKRSTDDEIQALLDHPRTLEEGNASSKSWSPVKARNSDGDSQTSGRSGPVSELDVLERRSSLTHTGFDEEIAQRFGAVITRKPFKRLPTSESL